MNKATNDIKTTIEGFIHSLQLLLPPLEAEVKHLIQVKEVDAYTIEGHLDTLLELTRLGVAEDLFITLLEYYKTVDEEGAAYYWNEFDKKDDDE